MERLHKLLFELSSPERIKIMFELQKKTHSNYHIFLARLI